MTMFFSENYVYNYTGNIKNKHVSGIINRNRFEYNIKLRSRLYCLSCSGDNKCLELIGHLTSFHGPTSAAGYWRICVIIIK